MYPFIPVLAIFVSLPLACDTCSIDVTCGKTAFFPDLGFAETFSFFAKKINLKPFRF